MLRAVEGRPGDGMRYEVERRVRRRVVHVVEVSSESWVNHRGEVFPAWTIAAIESHPEFANQKADVLRKLKPWKVRVRPATQ